MADWMPPTRSEIILDALAILWAGAWPILLIFGVPFLLAVSQQ